MTPATTLCLALTFVTLLILALLAAGVALWAARRARRDRELCGSLAALARSERADCRRFWEMSRQLHADVMAGELLPEILPFGRSAPTLADFIPDAGPVS